MNYAFFVHLRATTAWLQLPRERRNALTAEHLHPLLGPGAGLAMRYFDAEAFSASCSDVMLVETPDPRAWYFFMERLRDSPLIAHPYFDVVQIVPAIEGGFEAFERHESHGKSGELA